MPSGSASLGATYTLPLSDGRKLQIDGQAGYVGRSHLTFDAQHLLTQGDYISTSAQAALQGKTLRTSLFIDNLFDSRGDTFAFGRSLPYPAIRRGGDADAAKDRWGQVGRGVLNGPRERLPALTKNRSAV